MSDTNVSKSVQNAFEHASVSLQTIYGQALELDGLEFQRKESSAKGLGTLDVDKRIAELTSNIYKNYPFLTQSDSRELERMLKEYKWSFFKFEDPIKGLLDIGRKEFGDQLERERVARHLPEFSKEGEAQMPKLPNEGKIRGRA
jgi:hypothetical protein